MVPASHVEHGDRRQRPPVDTRGQPQPRDLNRALGPRRRAAHDQHSSVLARAPLGDRAGVVARVALVLVGPFVLLVDHDQPDLPQRREHRRASADADARLAAPQPQPLVVALAAPEARVQDRDDVPEPRFEPSQRLRRERDLRYEHDRAAPRGQRLLDGRQVDLGLARTGHALKQESRGRAAWALTP